MKKPRYVVATDLSPPSRTALAATVAIARRTGASVDLFCAVPAAIVDEQQTLVQRARDAVARLAKRTAGEGVETICEVAVTRDVPKAIVAHAASVAADLVAVGPSGVTGWKKFVLGSVTERLLRLCPAMLLVARGRFPDPPAAIVVALDMTPGSARAFRTAVALARSFGARLTALHVVAAPGAALMAAGDVYLPETWNLEAERVAAAEREFRGWVAALPAEGVDVEVRVVEGNAAEKIVDEAKTSGAPLVVVGSHGRSAVQELFVGSVARGVATHATTSVLVVRTAGGRRAAAAGRRGRRTVTTEREKPDASAGARGAR